MSDCDFDCRCVAVLTNSTIAHTNRWLRTYAPPVYWAGSVGGVFANNTITDAPHAGLIGNGNDNLFERNRIARVTYECDDCGSFYAGGDWYTAGNVLRFNTFESIRMQEARGALGVHFNQAIYLDDQGGNFHIYNNSFIDCQVGVLVNGGRRNSIKLNTFHHCDLAVFFRDAGEGCWPSGCGDNLIMFRMKQMPFATDRAWAVRYPEMANFEMDYPGLPVYTEIVGNRFCNTTTFINDCNACGLPDPELAHGPCTANQSSVIIPCSEKLVKYYVGVFAKNVEEPKAACTVDQ